MFIAIGFMLLGVLIGFLSRKKPITRKKPIKNTSKLITGLIWLLLFILGVEVGGNSQIVSGLPVIGVEALIITAAAVIGSAVAAFFLWKRIAKYHDHEK